MAVGLNRPDGAAGAGRKRRQQKVAQYTNTRADQRGQDTGRGETTTAQNAAQLNADRNQAAAAAGASTGNASDPRRTATPSTPENLAGTPTTPTGTSNTPLGQNLNFEMNGDQIMNDPDALTRGLFDVYGMDVNRSNGMYATMQDYVSKLDTMWKFLSGFGEGNNSIADYVDYVYNQVNGSMAGGGKFYAPEDIGAALGVNPGQNENFLNYQFNSPGMTARDQVNTYLSTFGNLMKGVMPSDQLQLMLAYMAANGDAAVMNSNASMKQDAPWKQMANSIGSLV